MYTSSSIFLKTLADAGITHAFVNWGSDHPALLEDLQRQRVEEDGNGRTRPEIVTCPNEMVALSAAQGYAQATGKPAAVIVHVDVGTQALAGAVHNVDRSRTPVLIYAGASPFSAEREHKGTRNEWIMWPQDIPDQPAIVRQYMRYTGQFGSGATVAKTVKRSLQIAMSEPKGPVYLWSRREVMEEEVPKSLLDTPADFDKWPAIEPSALSLTAATRIASALLSAQSPLIITSYLGQNHSAIPQLTSLSTLLAIPIVVSCPNSVSVPFSHPSFAGVTFLAPGTHSPLLKTADVVLVVDCALPWIPANDKPNDTARVFVVDSGDPLKENTGYWHVAAELVCRADAGLALKNITDVVNELDKDKGVLASQALKNRAERLTAEHAKMVRTLDEAEQTFPEYNSSLGSASSSITVPNILGVLRQTIQSQTPSKGRRTLILNESISNYPAAWAHLRPELPGSILSSGGSSLGYALGAAVGAYLGGQIYGVPASDRAGEGYDLIVAIVGDGSFLFGVPASAYWMARKYNTPYLTIVLNNGGWNSPKLSMLGVHPIGHGSKAVGDTLTVGFGPECPDYAQIAVAASSGWAWGKRVGVGEEGGKQALENAINEAVKIVLQERRCAVVDCVLAKI